MYLDEKVVLIQWETNKYWNIVCNSDWSAIWSGNTDSTPYTMLAYYDTTDLTYDYQYYAEAVPWTLITTAEWRCFRVQNDKDWNFISKKWAWVLFDNLWDETTVKWLTYS